MQMKHLLSTTLLAILLALLAPPAPITRAATSTSVQLNAPAHPSAYKKDSPSSGLFRVRVYNADKGTSAHGMAQRNGTGMFPREVVQRPPHQRAASAKQMGCRPICHGPHPPAAPGGGGPAQRPAAAREFHRASICLLSLEPNAKRGANAWKPGPCPCGQGRQVPQHPCRKELMLRNHV